MLHLINNTPFSANMSVLPDEQGIDSLYVNVKASFKIGQDWILSEHQPPPQAEDIYWGEPGSSSLRVASDIHTGKSGTDIAMNGQAYAPEKTPINQLDVSLRVGTVSKTIRVYGDREWRNGNITDPQPFTSMPLIYERAFGGRRYTGSGIVDVEPRNPVGVGIERPDVEGRPGRPLPPLPNLEDPNNLIQRMGDRPEPACFGFRAPGWQPRADFAGTYDNVWQKTRAPYLPTDFDPRFLNAAHPDLVYSGYLRGGERVEVTNMHPKGDLSFSIPYIKFSARVDLGKREETPRFNLETLLLEPNQLRMAMVWKAKVRCDKQLTKIRQVTLSLSR